MRESAVLVAGTVVAASTLGFVGGTPLLTTLASASTPAPAFNRVIDLDDIEATALLSDPDVVAGYAEAVADHFVSFEDVFGEPF